MHDICALAEMTGMTLVAATGAGGKGGRIKDTPAPELKLLGLLQLLADVRLRLDYDFLFLRHLARPLVGELLRPAHLAVREQRVIGESARCT